MANFQVVTPKKLAQAAISATPTVDTLYTVPGSTSTMVKDIDLANTTAASITVTLYLVPSAGTPGAGNVLLPSIPVPANGIQQWSGTQVLNAGDMIQATASAVGVTANISGGEAV